MENLESSQPQPEEIKLKIGGYGIKNLNEIRRWAKFFAILGFIGLGLMALGTILMAAGLSIMGGVSDLGGIGAGESLIIVVVMGLFIALYFFPTLYLWKFSDHAKKAIEAINDNEFEESLYYMKKYAKFIGILMIVVLSIYALMIPVLIITGAMAAL